MSDDLQAVPLLNRQVELPEFVFFQVVKVKTTKETIWWEGQ
jgi:hypothetical protein